MFIAMNRFKVRKGEEAAFEARSLERDIHRRAPLELPSERQSVPQGPSPGPL